MHETSASHPQRFLCDEMLTGLGKWLRAAGHDTLIASAPHRDRELVRTCLDHDRRLLTCDRRMLEITHADKVTCVLSAQGVQAQVIELNRSLDIDWLAAPLSRCLLCNGLLTDVAVQQIDRLPPDIRQGGQPVSRCTARDKLYWQGSHYRRLRARLQTFADDC